MYRLLFFTLITQLSWASNPNEMLSDKELSKKFVSLIKENEIDKLITNTKDFQDCRNKNPYKPDATADQKEQQIKAAQECFVKKIENKPTKDLQKLSDNLGLESYQLVKSKNVKDITNYLAQRMYKALTGISEEDQKNKSKLANMKFENKILVDQEHYFKLYSYQLTKNALLEVSRFCFQNLTNVTGPVSHPTTSFADHWKTYFDNPKATIDVSDQGNHKWVDDFSDATEPSAAYNKIFAGMGAIDPIKLGQFWHFCTNSMKTMCDKFNADSQDTAGSLRPGANSCLTINRLRNIRNAIAATEKTQEYMDENMKGGSALALDNGAKAKFFEAKDDNSYDNLTNIGSVDLLEKPDQSYLDLIAQCRDKPETAECDKFIAEGGTSSAELIHKIDQEMMIKQEVEIARILKIKEDSKIPFKEYLEQNGYFELAQLEDPNENDIKKFLAKNFQAQREAVTNKLRATVGSRQVVSDAPTEDKNKAIKASASEAQNERARLSQVILFNNIITSNLSLFNSQGETLGKNVGAWKKESEALAKSNINQSLYQNIQGVIDTSGAGSKNHSITGTDFIDQIIGKAAPEAKTK